MKQRATVLLFVFVWVLMGIGGRLIYLAAGKPYAQAAARQSLYTLHIDTPRGTIFDRNGQPITNRQTVQKVGLSATPQVISRVHTLFQGTEKETLLEQLSTRKPFLITTREDFKVTGAIPLMCRDNHPYYQPAIHLTGYLNGSGESGVCGLQKIYNALLSCTTPTTITYTCDAIGGALSGITPQITQDNRIYERGVVTTLDLTIQQSAKAAFPPLKRGAILVQQAGSGALLGFYSAPEFSPRDVAKAMENPALPLLNRGLSPYNVGSVFKLCVAAAALEAGISPERTYTCTGQITCSHTFACHKTDGHGTLNMEDALAVSCNPYFIDLAQAVGAEKVFELARRFGFGEPLSIVDDLTAQGGQMPSLEELMRSPAELANFAIGQGVFTATPLHILTMTNTIINGGVAFSPYLVSATVDSQGQTTPQKASTGRRVLSIQTAHTLLQMMEQVMLRGTGRPGHSTLVSSAGKTATAQTGMVNQNKQPINQGWFTGCFPRENPQYVVTILVEDARSGGQNATPVFLKLCEALVKQGLVTSSR